MIGFGGFLGVFSYWLDAFGEEGPAVERPPQGELALAVVTRPQYDHILASRPTQAGQTLRTLRATKRALVERLRY